MKQSLSKTVLVFLIISGPLLAFAQEQSCTGKIQSVATRAGVNISSTLLFEPVEGAIGNTLAIKADFTDAKELVICSLDSNVDTGETVDIDPANVDTSYAPVAGMPIPDSFLKNPVRVSGALCQQWLASSQLALALELDITLTYAAGQIDSCEQVGMAYPNSLRIER